MELVLIWTTLLVSFVSVKCAVLCESGYCRTFELDTGCSAPAQHCGINNATHSGLWLPSPTTCNCCEYCLPFYGADEPCSAGGPGSGTTVGRCGAGLTCATEDGQSRCIRMKTPCHDAQDDYDERHARGATGALESRPSCDGKGRYGPYHCVPTHTCYCQSAEGERIFGEAVYLGAVTMQNMHCGCSRFHEKIKKTISPGVRYPVIGPRCTSDGNFNPIQCVDRDCYCVNKITGKVAGEQRINLDEKPLSDLSCYDPTTDLFPEFSGPPFNYTTPCFQSMQDRIELIQASEEAGFNVDHFSTVPDCLPDGTFGRIGTTRNGTKICVDEYDKQIGNYEAFPDTPEFHNMDCKCAQTTQLLSQSAERPVCCTNGNFRPVQCRRGKCHCVDQDGRQVVKEDSDVTKLSCYSQDWRFC